MYTMNNGTFFQSDSKLILSSFYTWQKVEFSFASFLSTPHSFTNVQRHNHTLHFFFHSLSLLSNSLTFIDLTFSLPTTPFFSLSPSQRLHNSLSSHHIFFSQKRKNPPILLSHSLSSVFLLYSLVLFSYFTKPHPNSTYQSPLSHYWRSTKPPLKVILQLHQVACYHLCCWQHHHKPPSQPLMRKKLGHKLLKFSLLYFWFNYYL